MAKTLLPQDFSISEKMRTWAQSKGLEAVLEEEFEAFTSYWWGHGKQMADWNAVLRTWVLKNRAKAKPTPFNGLKARPLPSAPAPDPWKGDKWDEEAARHFLKYIRYRVSRHPQFFGRPGPIETPNETFKARVERFVAYKNAWAQDMREAGEPSFADQKRAWVEIMKRAEAELRQSMMAKVA